MDKPKLQVFRSELTRYQAQGGSWVAKLFLDHGAEALSHAIGKDDLLECFESVGGIKARRSARKHLRDARGRQVGSAVTRHGCELHADILAEVKEKLRRSTLRAKRRHRTTSSSPVIDHES